MARQSQTTGGGFTILELLVTIVIIALLLAILLPALGKARRTAQGAYCKTNLREIARCFHLFAEDHNGSTPSEYVDESWDQQLRPYAPDEDLFLCPGDKSRFAQEIRLSYEWRSEMIVGQEAAASRQNLLNVVRNDLLLVWDFEPEWHGIGETNAAQISTAAKTYSLFEWREDLGTPLK